MRKPKRIWCALVLLVALLVPMPIGAAIIFEEDFEGTTAQFEARGWSSVEWINFPGLMSLSTAQPYTGTQSLQYVFNTLDGSQTSRVVISHTTITPNFFFRYMMKTTPDFRLGTNGLTKHIELGGLSMAPVWTIEMEAPNGPSTHPGQAMWLIDPYGAPGPFRASTGVDVTDGQWHCIEGQALFNTPGQANGEIRLWVDNVLRYTRTGLELRGPLPGSSNPTGVIGSTASWGYHKFYQQSGLGTMWIDRFAVGDSRIGPPGGSPPPNNFTLALAAAGYTTTGAVATLTQFAGPLKIGFIHTAVLTIMIVALLQRRRMRRSHDVDG